MQELEPKPLARVSRSLALSEPWQRSIKRARQRFFDARLPSERDLLGRFRAHMIGPFWLRLSARPSIALAGLRGWWGKELSGFGPAQNLVVRGDQLSHALRMELAVAISLVDDKPCAALRYVPESPFPWRHVVDELRVVDTDCLLGMTVIDAPLLRRLAFPFLLVRSP